MDYLLDCMYVFPQLKLVNIKWNVRFYDIYCEWVYWIPCLPELYLFNKIWQIWLAKFTLFKGGPFMTVMIVFQDTSHVLWFIQSCKISESLALLSWDTLDSSDCMSLYPILSCSPILLHSCFTGSRRIKRWSFSGSCTSVD